MTDELCQDSMIAENMRIQTTEAIEEEPMDRETYQVLNPASTTSSLERIDIDR